MYTITFLHKNLGTASSGVVSAKSAFVHSVSCLNLDEEETMYLQLFAGAAVPESGAVPDVVVVVPASTQVVLGNEFFSNHGLAFANGVSWGFSSTATTYTEGTAENHITQVVWAKW